MRAGHRLAMRRASDGRRRSVILTLVLIMLAIMIVRDLLVRRWSSAGTRGHDVTQRST
jgi:hypothetical protein